jgi:hypothetical protein
MSLREVELSDLVLSIPGLWVNPRSFTGLDAKSINELGDDIRHRGIMMPLKIQKVRVPNEKKVLELVLDGQRRVVAAPKAGLKPSSKILVVDYSDEVIDLDLVSSTKLLLDMMALGNFRETISTYEQAEAADRLRVDGRSLAEIGKALRRSESWISRMISARRKATPQLLSDWRAGKLTDEMFKDLAEVAQADQGNALKEALDTRANGKSTGRAAKAEARARVKEVSQKAKAEKPKKEPKRKGKAAAKAASSASTALVRNNVPSRAELQELVDMLKKRPPTSDYVLGIRDAVRYAVGELMIGGFAKAWRTYLARVEGSAKPSGDKPKKVSKAEQRKRDRDQVKKALSKGKK